MCPQLLSRVKPNALAVYGAGCLAKRPELSSYVGEVIEIWSYCDATYTSMLTNFLQADFRVAHAMLHALKSADAKRQVIQAAADETLNDDDLIIFNAVKACTTASRNKRNEFAHCLWGISDDLPDAILLADPKHLTTFMVNLAAHSAGLEKDEQQKTQQMMTDERSKIYVYRENDLIREVNEAQWARAQINLLSIFLSWTEDEGRAQARAELLREPRVQESVASLYKKNNPESQPQSPPQEPPEK